MSVAVAERITDSSWSPQQELAIKEVRAWLREPSRQVFKLFGYAGTGKTTLANEMADGVGGKVLFGAFTGKASLVLRRKGCRNASTIHSMIYSFDEANTGWEPRFILNPGSDVADAALVVIDECSRVDAELGKDLLSFGTKVLVLGDPAQLPPVKGAGFFTAGEPDFMLTEVHRQARDNPIIAMSMLIREGGRLDFPRQICDVRRVRFFQGQATTFGAIAQHGLIRPLDSSLPHSHQIDPHRQRRR